MTPHILIQVTSHDGLPPPAPIRAEFNELGGNIGREVGNALVLPDPKRHISRTHACISLRADRYVLRDMGSAMPVYINGTAVGNGREATLADGDEIRIGPYTMSVSYRDAFTVTRPAPAPAATTSAQADPLAMFGESAGSNPFADLLAPAPKAALSTARAASEGTSSAPTHPLPDDFDPFASPVSPADAQRAKATLPDNLELGLGPAAVPPSIDMLFDLKPDLTPETFPPGNPLAEPLRAPDAAQSLDPLVVLGVVRSPPRPGAPQRDDVSELHAAFDVRPGISDRAVRAAVVDTSAAAAKDAAAPSSEPHGVVLSWETTQRDAHASGFTATLIPSPQAAPPSHDVSHAGVAVQPRVAVHDSVQRGGAAAASTQSSADTSAVVERDTLLQAFLAGAGVTDIELRGELTPELMQQWGQLLRAATQGTLDLLMARALTKREVRADMTMIAAQENNPLKFSPNVDVALAHLLAPQGRGFMTPLQALCDAYNDLRAHQFGFMAGMRAALADVLERFDPKQLEQRLAQKSMIDSVLPMNRKAKLWDLYMEFYQDISTEAEDDFHALFGKEFLRAYEAQVAQLAQHNPKASG